MRAFIRGLGMMFLGAMLLHCGMGTLSSGDKPNPTPSGTDPDPETDGGSVVTDGGLPPSADTRAPQFGGAVSAVANAATVEVTWAAATDDRDAPSALVYRIYQAEVAGGQIYSVPTATTLPGVTRYSATRLVDGDTYYFVVRAVDAAGNEDTNRIEVSALVTDGLPPSPGPAFRVTPVYADTEASAGTLEVSWEAWNKDPRIEPLISYQLCWTARNTNHCNPFTAMRTLTPADAKQTTLSGLDPATPYDVFLRPLASNTVVGRVTPQTAITATSFSKQILRGILQASNTSGGCTAAGCHGGDGWTYAELVNVNTSNANCSVRVRVVPGSPENSLVYRKMGAAALPANCGERMPRGGPFSSELVQWMFDWIRQGAKRN